MDLNEDLVEPFIENINIHCFKRRLTAEEFINIINKVSALSKNLGIPVEQLPDYIKKKSELEKVKGETEDAEIKQLQVLQHYNVTMDDLEEYKRNIPLIDHIKQLKTN
jgi:peptidoglycan hydrolase CwlO-like protein